MADLLTTSQRTRISKLLSQVLRHQPELVGIVLDDEGWTPVDELLERIHIRGGMTVSLAELEEVVRTSPKQRFALDMAARKIRANQGHSVPVKLVLVPLLPPRWLYHGTAEHFVRSIWAEGLRRQRRHHVHLSEDAEVARQVGARHGRPYIFRVLSGRMAEEGFDFFQSENGVWLTDHVPWRFLVPHSPVRPGELFDQG